MSVNKILLSIAVFAMLFLASCVFRTTVRDGDYRNGPFLIVIPGTYVYYYDGADNDIYFYSGRWWRFYGDTWYRSDDYSGPWVFIEITRVPRPVIILPSRRHDWRDRDRIPWDDVRNHWREWERDRYWEQHNWKQEEKRHPREYQRDDRDDRRDYNDRDKREPDNRDKNNKRPREPKKMKAAAELD